MNGDQMKNISKYKVDLSIVLCIILISIGLISGYIIHKTIKNKKMDKYVAIE